ncbi:hypothetical protein SteCoe_28695 [Stentor coeruleus]|uniref:Uncharacterized protein n=1 Tax=Stentor coeruleus TaxID=5963 RepID=A0A1R2B7N2_9CILI|nr:hypothetical protein SteCoe_28695 [Stentor coeruleus]
MSYRAYNNKTLVQNWYEDRLAPPQVSKLYPSEMTVREKEDSISCLTSAGVPKALNTLKRQQKWNTAGVIPDDGFREMYTVNKTEIPDPQKTKEEVSKPPVLYDINGKTQQTMQKSNIISLTHIERETTGPKSGFGAVLPKHPDTWDKRYFETTYNCVHGEPGSKPKPTVPEHSNFITTNQTFYNTGKELVGNSAGISYKPGFLDSLKEKSELLCAEKLRTSEDPQHNTVIQRTWLPTQDPGVKARLSGNKIELPKVDNENSLPLGIGQYFVQEKKDNPGAYRRVRSDVTTAPVEHVRMALR